MFVFVLFIFFSRVYANETEYKFSCIVFYVELLLVVALHLTIYLRRHAKVKKKPKRKAQSQHLGYLVYLDRKGKYTNKILLKVNGWQIQN